VVTPGSAWPRPVLATVVVESAGDTEVDGSVDVERGADPARRWCAADPQAVAHKLIARHALPSVRRLILLVITRVDCTTRRRRSGWVVRVAFSLVQLERAATV
jgi:hypothetical protein